MKAKDDLRRAHKQLRNMEKADSLEDFEDAWNYFIGDLNRVFSAIEALQGVGGRIAPRVGRVIHDRRTDPLLKYLEQARHSFEHRSALSINREPPSIGFTNGYIEHLEIEITSENSYAVHTDHPDNTSKLIFSPAYIYPIDTIDRQGSAVPVPDKHRGRDIEDHSPVTLAKLGFKYYEVAIEQLSAIAKRK